MFSFVLGAGDRLFGDTSDKTALRRLDVRPVGTSLLHVRYEVIGNAVDEG